MVSILVLISGCGFGGGTTQTYKNDEINPSLKSSFKELRDKVVSAIKANDSEAIIKLGNKDIRKDSDKVKQLLEQFSKTLKDDSFIVKDEYYSKLNKVGEYRFVIPSSLSKDEEDRYVLQIDGISDEIYVPLLISNKTGAKYMVAPIFGKENNNWVLAGLHIGQFSCQDLNAIQLYNEAKKLENKGYLLPAVLYADLATKVLRPAIFFQYEKESDVQKYRDKIISEIQKKYKFPMITEIISSKPEIFNIDVINVEQGGLTPSVNYKSIKMNDVEGLKVEAEELTSFIEQKFPGTLESFNYIGYRAYSEIASDPNKQYYSYGTVIDTHTKKKIR